MSDPQEPIIDGEENDPEVQDPEIGEVRDNLDEGEDVEEGNEPEVHAELLGIYEGLDQIYKKRQQFNAKIEEARDKLLQTSSLESVSSLVEDYNQIDQSRSHDSAMPEETFVKLRAIYLAIQDTIKANSETINAEKSRLEADSYRIQGLESDIAILRKQHRDSLEAHSTYEGKGLLQKGIARMGAQRKSISEGSKVTRHIAMLTEKLRVEKEEFERAKTANEQDLKKLSQAIHESYQTGYFPGFPNYFNTYVAEEFKELEERQNNLAIELSGPAIHNFIQTELKGQLESQLLREEIWMMSEAEFREMLFEQAEREEVESFVNSENHAFILSDRALQKYGLSENDSHVKPSYDTSSGMFKLTTVESGRVLEIFERKDIWKQNCNFLTEIVPGEIFNKKYKCVESDLLNGRAKFEDTESGEIISLQTPEEIGRFFSPYYAVRAEYDTGELSIYHSDADPTKMYAGYYNFSKKKWFIRRRQDGQVILSRPEGDLSPENFDETIAMYEKTAEGEKYIQSKDHTNEPYYYINSVRAIKNVTEKAIAQRVQKKALEYQSEEDACGNRINYLGSEDLRHEYADILAFTSAHLIAKYFEDPQVAEFLGDEKDEIIKGITETARRKLMKNENVAHSIEVIYQFGEGSDLQLCLLMSLESSDEAVRDKLFNLYKSDPEAFKSRLSDATSDMPVLGRVVDLFERSAKANQDEITSFKLSEFQKEIAPKLRTTLVSGDLDPEAKVRIFHILGVHQSSINLENSSNPDGTIDQPYAKELVKFLRSLSGAEEYSSPAQVSDQDALMFCEGVKRLSEEGLTNSEIAYFLNMKETICYLARNPQQAEAVSKISEECPEFIQMIGPDGILRDNRDRIIAYLFSDGTVTERAKSIVTIFGGAVPLHEKLFSFMEVRLNEDIESSTSNYPVMVDGETRYFCTLPVEQRKHEIKSRLRDSIERSRSMSERIRLTERNSNCPTTFELKAGMYLHGLPCGVLGEVYKNGNLCGEALGEKSDTDSYPFQVDYTHVTSDLQPEGRPITEVIANFAANSWGDSTDESGFSKQAILVTDRERAEWEKGIVYRATPDNPNHTLILAASPNSEIHAVLLRDPRGSLREHIAACTSQEIYIPAYALKDSEGVKEGQLLFSYQDYLAELASRKPYKNINEFINDTAQLDSFDVTQPSSGHRFTLKNHLILAKDYCLAETDKYGVEGHDRDLIALASLLHDIGKQQDGEQAMDNPLVASTFLEKIQGLSSDDIDLVLTLIKNDELLGDILKGEKKPEEFERILPDKRQQVLMLCLYKADVRAIDGDTEEGSFYKAWQVEQKLQDLGLEREAQ